MTVPTRPVTQPDEDFLTHSVRVQVNVFNKDKGKGQVLAIMRCIHECDL